MAIGEAVDFHNMIGSKRKEERLRFLKNYWAEKAVKIPKVKMNTSLNPKYSCALCNMSMEGWTASEMDTFLYEKYKIHVIGIPERFNGIRVTPSVYTSTKDLDLFVEALTEMSKSTPPVKK
jgi:selenocysteine lyase/cysteine desulfurase